MASFQLSAGGGIGAEALKPVIERPWGLTGLTKKLP